LLFQIVLAGLLGSWVYFHPELGGSVYIPFIGSVPPGPWYIAFVVLVAVSAANAVNLTDGLDGLAAGTVTIALLAYTVIALEQQSKIAIFTAAAASSCLGFIWFNGYPAPDFYGRYRFIGFGCGFGGSGSVYQD